MQKLKAIRTLEDRFNAGDFLALLDVDIDCITVELSSGAEIAVDWSYFVVTKEDTTEIDG